MFYYNNKTDQGDEMEGMKIEGSGGRDWRGRVRRDYSLFWPNLKKILVHSAPCSCIIELSEKWDTFADFSQNGIFRRKDQRSCDGQGGGLAA